MSKNEIISDITKYISFNYFIKKKYEAGIVLFGWEIKSIKINGIEISNSFITIKNHDVLMIGSIINLPSFIFKYSNIDEKRNRKLLLNKNEIKSLNGLIKLKRYTIVPSKVYWKDSFIKIELFLCIGKSTLDKRELIKKKEWNLLKNSI